MEFNEKLQELRKQKELTQEDLAKKLYVSRTAISKWESGRGYPSIESLKSISTFFGITLDSLLSSDEVLTIAEENQKRNENHFRDLIFGLLDVCMLLLLFLPIFASNSDGTVRESSLLFLDISSVYVKTIYLTLVGLMSISGTLMLALQNCSSLVWLKIKSKLSLMLGIFAVLVFIIGRQPYAAVFSFSMLVVKASLLLKRL